LGTALKIGEASLRESAVLPAPRQPSSGEVGSKFRTVPVNMIRRGMITTGIFVVRAPWLNGLAPTTFPEYVLPSRGERNV
jgi:hypothetical protein